MTLCECGCGGETKPGKRFIHGHNLRRNDWADIHVCRICGNVLTDDNWFASCEKSHSCICKTCSNRYEQERRRNRPAMITMADNRNSTLFLGVHVAERVLSKVFKNVKRMPINNPGYDFICSRGKKIDVKSSCLVHTKGRSSRWAFKIRKNTTADHFLCIAFDNREDLTPLHLWLVPGNVLNMFGGTTVSLSTINRWEHYRLPLDDVVTCCESMKR